MNNNSVCSETWSLTFREECRLKVFKKCVLEKNLNLRTTMQQGTGGKCTIRSSKFCTPHQILFRLPNADE